MKKIVVLLTAFITVLTLAAFSINFTLAFFADKHTTKGTDASAGYLEVSVNLELANFGVPGDSLLTSNGSSTTPAKSTVTVTNSGSMDMDYTLSLTISKETYELLDTNGFELRDAEDIPLKFTGDPTIDEHGNRTYVYESATALKNGEIDTYSLVHTFKGKTFPKDGNYYQGKLISVAPAVVAIQTGGA